VGREFGGGAESGMGLGGAPGGEVGRWLGLLCERMAWVWLTRPQAALLVPPLPCCLHTLSSAVEENGRKPQGP
jgi:hypothetical protein